MKRNPVFPITVALLLLSLTLSPAFALEIPQHDNIVFSASTFRQDIPSAFGLYKNETVADYSSFQVKMPSGLEDKKADFKEGNLVYAPLDNLYVGVKKTSTHLEGTTRAWDSTSDEYGFQYKLKESEDQKSAMAFSYRQRTINLKPITIKATGFVDTVFTSKGKWDSVGFVMSRHLDLQKGIHYSLESAKIKYANLSSTTNKLGVGFDYVPNIKNPKLKLEANLIVFKNSIQSINQMLSGRLIYNVGKGINLSFDGAAFMKGMAVGGTRFSDNGMGSMIFDPAVLPDTIKKFQDKRFGYWGVSLTYGIRF